MVYFMENPIKMDDFGGISHHFRKPPCINHERNKDPGTLTNQDCSMGNPAGHGGEVVDLETSSLETREGRGDFDDGMNRLVPGWRFCVGKFWI